MRPQSVWLQRLAAALLGVLVVALACAAAFRSVDFPVYHHVAQALIAGDHEIYPAAVYTGGPIPPHGFRYLPAVAFLFVPFGFLPLQLAALVFFILKAAACVYIGSVVARRAGVSSARREVIVIAVVLVGGYVAEEFRGGNFHFLSIALMVLAFDTAESGEVLLPAVALSLAIATKVTPIVLLGYFALRRRWAVCVATVGVLVGMAVVPAILLGTAENTHLLKGFFAYAMEKTDEGNNFALRGVLVRYLTTFHEGDAARLPTSLVNLSLTTVTGIWVLLVLALGLVALLVIRREVQEPKVRLLEFSIVVTGMVLASPHTQRIYLVALYVPVLVLTALLVRAPRSPESRAMQIGLAATALSGTILPLVFAGRTLALDYEAASPYFFGTAILFWALLSVTVRLKTAASSSPRSEGQGNTSA